ncbi:hypothetical protein BJ912DRAFT_913138 [Pholiota molesta]|nr:hypothetical protein BJ912DRAFT_913138 [Pholiota molesta]
MEWISAPEARLKFILWMYGPAGSGKTAIGQSIAEECRKKGLLAASFFFSRTAAGRNDTKRVVATIAYQISLHLPQIQDHLFTAIERDPTIFSRALATQMQVLIVEPLKALPPLSQPIFVILDGLDEAGPTSQDQANLLNVIGTATSELQHLPLIFLVASRPEYEIREAFNGQLSPLTQSLVLDDTYKPDDDIRLYLTSTFEEIRGKQVKLGTELPSPWPSESDVDRLVSKASGQFIFAATVLKFIDSIRHHPAERLDIIFGLSTPGNETPFALLDALYSYILSSAEEPAKVLQIFTALVLTNPNIFLRDRDIEQLLDLDVRRVLVDMHALISVPAYEDHTTHLKFHHASLSDFLMDRLRSHKFYISASQGHIDLTRHWWKAMSNSQFPGHDFSDSECLHHFIYHCTKSPAGIELIGDLARFDLKELLKEYCRPYLLMYSPWKGFFECIKQQVGHLHSIGTRFTNILPLTYVQLRLEIEKIFPAG